MEYFHEWKLLSCFALHRHVGPIWITNLRHLLMAQTHWYRPIMSRMTIIGSRPPRLEWQATLKRDTPLDCDVNKMSMVERRRENWAIKRLKSLEEVLVGSENEMRCWKFIKITFRSTNASPKGFCSLKRRPRGCSINESLNTGGPDEVSRKDFDDNKRRVVGDQPK